jgi:hypothetical protein
MVGLGRVREFIQVLAVGMKDFVEVTSANVIDRFRENPNTGSLSAPVANCRTCCKVSSPLLPPKRQNDFFNEKM